MKMLIAAFAMVLSSATYAESLAPLVCTYGDRSESDNFMRVTLLQGNVEFEFHEGAFSATAAQTVGAGNTIAVLDQTLLGWAEGEDTKTVVNALLVYDPVAKTLNTTIIGDGYNMAASQILNCK